MTDLETGVKSIHEQSGGMLDVALYDGQRGAMLFEQAVEGDNDAALAFRAIAECAFVVRKAARRKPVLCCACPRAVRRISNATIFGLCKPYIDDPKHALAFVFCDRCSASRDNLAEKATRAIQRLWPNAREVAITHADGGRA